MSFNEFNNDRDSKHCIDLDSNVTCKMYDPEQLKHPYDEHNFSLLHANISSLNKHHDDLTSLLHLTGCSFDIIGNTETWLHGKSCIDLLNIDGYSLHHSNRNNRQGGGVCLYTRNNLHIKRCDFDLDDEHCESLFIELNHRGKTFIIGVIYRPPDSPFDTFRYKLENLLHRLNRLHKDCIILGDFNVDISKNNAIQQDFINTLHYSSFFPTINTFTRIKPPSKSIIDNFLTNIRNTKIATGVIHSDITDHFPIAFFIGTARLSSTLLPKTQKIKLISITQCQLHSLILCHYLCLQAQPPIGFLGEP